MFKRLLLTLALGAALVACTPAPGTNSGATVAPSAAPSEAAPSEAAPSDATPSESAPTESASPAAS